MDIALIFGYGQKKDGSIDEQTMDRCQKAIRMYHDGRIKKIFLTVSATKNGTSMAEAMKRFMTRQGVYNRDVVIEPFGANTAGELDTFLSIVPTREKLLFISTWYHIPRIIWLASWRLPQSKFSVGVAWRHAHFRVDILMEFLKIANAVLRPRSSSKFFQISLLL